MNTILVTDCCLMYSHKTEQVIKCFCGTAQNVVSEEIVYQNESICFSIVLFPLCNPYNLWTELLLE